MLPGPISNLVMALLMACYAIHRFLNELLRSDKRPGDFEMIASLLLLAAGVGLFVWRRWWTTGERLSG